MRELIVGIDHWLFLKINHEWTNSFLDLFFPFFTNILKYPIIAYILIPISLAIAFYKNKEKTGKVLLSTLVVVGISDFIGYQILKASFKRPRPHHTEIGSIVKVPYAPKSYSFPSNHALNSMAIAQNLAYYFPPLRPFLYFFALLMSYSRVYVGVHYPLDVLAGGIIGLLLAIFIRWMLLNRISNRLVSRK